MLGFRRRKINFPCIRITQKHQTLLISTEEQRNLKRHRRKQSSNFCSYGFVLSPIFSNLVRIFLRTGTSFYYQKGYDIIFWVKTFLNLKLSTFSRERKRKERWLVEDIKWFFSKGGQTISVWSHSFFFFMTQGKNLRKFGPLFSSCNPFPCLPGHL